MAPFGFISWFLFMGICMVPYSLAGFSDNASIGLGTLTAIWVTWLVIRPKKRGDRDEH